MNRSRHFVGLIAACLIGYAGGRMTSFSPAAAEVRKSVPREAFESGAERSLHMLDMIARHTKSIDERVARIERAIANESKNAAKK